MQADFRPEFVVHSRRRDICAAAAMLLFAFASASGELRGAASPVPAPRSVTSLGTNPLLAEGSRLLESGRVEEGIHLTQEGLESMLETDGNRAAGYSNLCAGYAMLKRWDEALLHCDTALRLDPASWRAYNNRAAVYSAKALYDRALDDLRAALRIAPQSQTLRTSLDTVQRNIRIQRELQRERSPHRNE